MNRWKAGVVAALIVAVTAVAAGPAGANTKNVCQGNGSWTGYPGGNVFDADLGGVCRSDGGFSVDLIDVRPSGQPTCLQLGSSVTPVTYKGDIWAHTPTWTYYGPVTITFPAGPRGPGQISFARGSGQIVLDGFCHVWGGPAQVAFDELR